MSQREPTVAEQRHQRAVRRFREEHWFSRQTNYPYFIYAVILVVLTIIMVQLSLWVRSFDPEERKLLKAARFIREQLTEYFQDNWSVPLSLSELDSYQRPERGWPLNPYTGQPIVDSGSATFDPATSPGTVHYTPLKRGEDVIGWKLYIFSADGELWCYQSRLHMAE